MQPIIATCRARPRLAISFEGRRLSLLLRRRHNGAAAAAAAPGDGRPTLRMAVIGSGPAGFYTAYRVMSKIRARVDMYEALPVPYGLVRFGVAPDHPEVKNCQEKFDEVAQSPDFRFVGNVAVGRGQTGEAGQTGQAHSPDGGSVPLEVLARHYNAVVFAYGASRDRLLGVPGEQLRGVYAARDFVGWYNGLPAGEDGSGQHGQKDLQDTIAADLASAETAVVVGQGNVALDVARMLLEDVDVLRQTDISEAAVDALASSRVKRVHVIGRRAAMQAAFTIKEVRELTRLSGVAMHPVDAGLIPPSLKELPRAQRRLMEVLAKGSAASVDDARKSWSLDFCLAPRHFSDNASAPGRVATAAFERTRLADLFDRNAQVVATGAGAGAEDKLVDLPASLVFRSIGYRSQPLVGFDALAIPFDGSRGLILNDGRGRVLREIRSADAAMSSGPYPGFYCAGWVKRGPTGVIASTMEDAFATADAIVHDWQTGAAFLHRPNATADGAASTAAGWDGVCSEVDTSNARVVSWSDWQRIDAAEIERGARLGKPRNKFTRTADMLAVVG